MGIAPMPRSVAESRMNDNENWYAGVGIAHSAAEWLVFHTANLGYELVTSRLIRSPFCIMCRVQYVLITGPFWYLTILHECF